MEKYEIDCWQDQGSNQKLFEPAQKVGGET